MTLQSVNEAHSRLLDFIRRSRPSCEILSKGDRCTCLLCSVDLLAFHARRSAALTPPAVELPDSEGWWWEWSDRGWLMRECKLVIGKMHWWWEGVGWLQCVSGRWVKASPPQAPPADSCPSDIAAIHAAPQCPACAEPVEQAGGKDYPDLPGWYLCDGPTGTVAFHFTPNSGKVLPMFKNFIGPLVPQSAITAATAELTAKVERLEGENQKLNTLVYELETNCDPSGNVRVIVTLRENAAALESQLTALREQLAATREELGNHQIDREGVMEAIGLPADAEVALAQAVREWVAATARTTG